MENTAASGAETQQNQPPSMESAAPTSLYPTHPSYVYADPQYALYYQQSLIANPNLQQHYDTNGSLVHPPGVDPNQAAAYANASTYLDPQQLAYYYGAYPHTVASGQDPNAAYYQDPNAAHLAFNPYSNGAAMQQQPAVAQRPANPNYALRGKRNNNNMGGVRRTTSTTTPLKKRPKIAKVVQSAWCEVCKVDCNSKDVLDKHKMGKKHKKNIDKLIAASKPAPPPPPPQPPQPQVAVPPVSSTSDVSAIIGPQENPNKGKPIAGSKRGKRKAAERQDLETKKKKMLDGGTLLEDVRSCDVCSVVCNSETVFNYHLAGQKHALMVKRHASKMKRLAYNRSRTAAATATTSTVTTNPETGTVTTNPETGIVTTNPETGIVTTNAETGTVTTKAETGIVTIKDETGIVTIKAETGNVTTNAETGTVTIKAETGTTTIKAETGTTTIKAETGTTTTNAETSATMSAAATT